MDVAKHNSIQLFQDGNVVLVHTHPSLKNVEKTFTPKISINIYINQVLTRYFRVSANISSMLLLNLFSNCFSFSPCDNIVIARTKRHVIGIIHTCARLLSFLLSGIFLLDVTTQVYSKGIKIYLGISHLLNYRGYQYLLFMWEEILLSLLDKLYIYTHQQCMDLKNIYLLSISLNLNIQNQSTNMIGAFSFHSFLFLSLN